MRASERKMREQRLGDAFAARMAQADGKAWKAYTRKLEGR
jgi:hypothetical protein